MASKVFSSIYAEERRDPFLLEIFVVVDNFQNVKQLNDLPQHYHL
jgi:hypothetical protein